MTGRSRRRERRQGGPRAIAAVSALVAVGLAAPACTPAPLCAPLAACGGDLLAAATDVWKNDGVADSEWIVTGQGSCMNDLHTPPVPVSLVRQPPRSATDRPPDRATADWCSNLVFNQDGTLRQFVGWYPPIPVRDGALTLSADGTYTMQLTYADHQRVELSASCLSAQGVSMSCPQLGRQLKTFVAAEANIHHVICYAQASGGCACEHELTLIVGITGRWAAGGSRLAFFDDLFGPPAVADYCLDATAGALDLTGQNGARLFNQAALRTLRLRRPSCDDGVQSRTLGEAGADCGGQCGGVCPRCDDGQRNGAEEGVDCGGPCPDPCACFDGAQNPWEEGVDCGGPCTVLCPP